jgi:hypothetical protein
MSDKDNEEKLNKTLEILDTQSTTHTGWHEFDQLEKSDYQMLSGVVRQSMRSKYVVTEAES